MPQVSQVLGAIVMAIGVLLNIKINNPTYRYIAWTLKIIAQIIEIVLGGILLGTDIAPNLRKSRSVPDYLNDPAGYRDAAYAYIAFFTLETIVDISYWTFAVCTGCKKTSAAVTLLMSVVCDMPIMMCGIYLMKAKGTINWDEQKFDLVFQIWYIVNIMLQITADLAEKVKFWGVIIVLPLSYLVACLPYACVTIAMSGWHWFIPVSDYLDNNHSFVQGTFNSTHSRNMLNFLIVTGFVGQWIRNLVFILIIGERGIELFNSWDLQEDEQKKLKHYWEGFESAVKPHSNELMAAWELYNLNQGNMSIEEFISRLRLLVKEANYPTDQQDRFLRDYFVFGMSSTRVRKECLKEGDLLTFQKAKNLAKAEESADNQMKIMNKTTDVHALHRYKGPSDFTPQAISVEVADVTGPAIIGNLTAQSLNLLKLNWPVEAMPSANAPKGTTNTKGKQQHHYPLSKEYILKEYEDVFTGIGCFPGPEYHIEVDPDVSPIQHPPRKVPVHLQSAYKEELKRLKELGILCEVKDEYTPWISSTVVTTKPNGSIRICLDPRDLNKAVKRNPYYVRSVDDVIPKVSGATHFSILDARSGYWQVKLDEESSKLCTFNTTSFNTPWGKYRWTRLPFGLTCSGDVFQEKMDYTFGGLKGVSGIADDTFIYGTGEDQHDQHILGVLDTARRNNVKFNPDKFQFKVAETSFFGLKWTPEGLKTDERKIQAIVDMPPPKNLKELQSFMGMVNYLNRFSPIIAQISEPIRNLMKKETPFIWQTEHQRAFQEIKQAIVKAPILAYYNKDKDNVIQSDASMQGVGCVLMQDGKPICYASRSLTDAESRYSNIERELLAACWSLEKFHHYIYGKKVAIETDHKPLESIWKKSIASASPRLQRMLLRMSRYEAEVTYIPGKTNVVADALSRVSYMESPTTDDDPRIEVDTVTHTLPATPAKLQEIRDLTHDDVTLCHLKDVVYRGWPEYMKDCPLDLKEYWNFREDLSVENGIVLKGPPHSNP
ncbi:hypothetical protein QZH41_001046 [Actinostola sp. cb2023]|nr:hypothetical protein QZH41_001046 [Actinostola sp. cb2023]